MARYSTLTNQRHDKKLLPIFFIFGRAGCEMSYPPGLISPVGFPRSPRSIDPGGTGSAAAGGAQAVVPIPRNQHDRQVPGPRQEGDRCVFRALERRGHRGSSSARLAAPQRGPLESEAQAFARWVPPHTLQLRHPQLPRGYPPNQGMGVPPPPRGSYDVSSWTRGRRRGREISGSSRGSRSRFCC